MGFWGGPDVERISTDKKLAHDLNLASISPMNNMGFTYWQDGHDWLGYLDEFPDYVTQGSSLADLKEHLLDLHNDLTSGVIPNVRRHAELELA